MSTMLSWWLGNGKHYVTRLTIDGVHRIPAGYDWIGPLVEDAIAAQPVEVVRTAQLGLNQWTLWSCPGAG